MKFGDLKPGRKFDRESAEMAKYHNYHRFTVGMLNIEVLVFGYDKEVVLALPQTSIIMTVEQAKVMRDALDDVIKAKGGS